MVLEVACGQAMEMPASPAHLCTLALALTTSTATALTSAGFCYINDIVLAVLELLKVHQR